MKNRIILSGQGFKDHFGKFSVQVSDVLSYRMDANPTNKVHSHAEYEFNLVISGTGFYYHDGTTYELKRGDIFVSDPFVKHEINSMKTKDLNFLWINVYINEVGVPVTNRYEDHLVESFLEGHQNYLEGQFFLLDYIPQLSRSISSISQRKLSCQLITKALFFDFMELTSFAKLQMDCLDNMITQKPYSYINRASNYILNNICAPLSVADVAQAVYTSERNLRHLFRDHLNTTVIGYINEKKMEHATLLLKLMMPVQEVGETVGIMEPSQFSRLFKKYYHVSPKQYQLACTRKKRGELL